MKILLINTFTRLRLPGRNHDGSFINPALKDVVLVCYEICDENHKWITTPVGRDSPTGYSEHPEEAEMRLKLQLALGAKKLAVVPYRTPDNRVRFEAIRTFPCEVEINI